MLAADKLLLRSTVKQKTIELREKELNLFNANFSAVATQAALLAGFSMAFLEMSVHLHGEHHNYVAKAALHLFSTICICANVFTVSVITFVSVWGSGKALRGKDGSMGKVVEGMNKERWLIFRCFGVGLCAAAAPPPRPPRAAPAAAHRAPPTAPQAVAAVRRRVVGVSRSAARARQVLRVRAGLPRVPRLPTPRSRANARE